MKALIRSFQYAFRGFGHALRHERNMRIHLVCMLYMYYFLFCFDWFTLTQTDWALLFIANALVLMSELLNTAVEATIDLIIKQYDKHARIAKDTAAAAVLVCALFAVAIGAVLLWQPEAFRALYQYHLTHPAMLVALLISFALAGLFVFQTPKKD